MNQRGQELFSRIKSGISQSMPTATDAVPSSKGKYVTIRRYDLSPPFCSQPSVPQSLDGSIPLAARKVSYFRPLSPQLEPLPDTLHQAYPSVLWFAVLKRHAWSDLTSPLEGCADA